MARGRDWSLWWHTAALMAFQANLKRDPKKCSRAYRAVEFHPYESKKVSRTTAINRESMGTVIAMFVKPEKVARAEARAEAERKLADRLAAAQLQRLRLVRAA